MPAAPPDAGTAPNETDPGICTTFCTDSAVAHALCEGVPLEDRDDFVKALVDATEADEDCTRRLFCTALLVEYRIMCERREPHSFLRSNRVPSLISDAIAKRETLPSLRRALRPAIRAAMVIAPLPEEMESVAASTEELAPSAASTSGEGTGAASRSNNPTDAASTVEDSVQRVVDDVDATISKIILALQGVPPTAGSQEDSAPSFTRRPMNMGFADFRDAVRSIASHCEPLIEGLEADVVVERALVAYACLRVLAPFIANPPAEVVAPHDSGGSTSDANGSIMEVAVPWSSRDRKRFMLVAKVLQKIANRSSFGQQPNASTASEGPSASAIRSSSDPAFLERFDGVIAKHTEAFHRALCEHSGGGTALPMAAGFSTQATGLEGRAYDPRELRKASEIVLARIVDTHARSIAFAASKLHPSAPLVDVSVLRALGVYRRCGLAIGSTHAAGRVAGSTPSSPAPHNLRPAASGTAGGGFPWNPFRSLFGKNSKSPPPSAASSPPTSQREIAADASIIAPAPDATGPLMVHSGMGSMTDHTANLDSSFASVASSAVMVSAPTAAPDFLEAVKAGCEAINSRGSSNAAIAWDVAQHISLLPPRSIVVYEEGLRRVQKHSEVAAAAPEAVPLSPSLGPRNRRMSSAEYVVFAHIAARMWTLLGTNPVRAADDHVNVVFVSHLRATAERRDWGATWFVGLLDELFPETVTDVIDKVLIVKPTLLGKLVRRFSGGGSSRRMESLEHRIVNVSSAADVISSAMPVSGRDMSSHPQRIRFLPLPQEHLDKVDSKAQSAAAAGTTGSPDRNNSGARVASVSIATIVRGPSAPVSLRYVMRVLSVCGVATRLPHLMARAAEEDAKLGDGRCDVRREREHHARQMESNWVEDRALADGSVAALFLPAASMSISVAGGGGAAAEETAAAVLDLLRLAAERAWPADTGAFEPVVLLKLLRIAADLGGEDQPDQSSGLSDALQAALTEASVSPFLRALMQTACVIGRQSAPCVSTALMRSMTMSRYAESARGIEGMRSRADDAAAVAPLFSDTSRFVSAIDRICSAMIALFLPEGDGPTCLRSALGCAVYSE